ncbi:MAG: response regulator [Gammaproteobacteria bacterium]|nr:response regulator [Gammaproteobacteria bacterium]
MKKTALIVDDSRTARMVLQKMLEVHDLAVDNASSAEDALGYLSESRPDIIFMDHAMPGMDGFEAVSAIKANPATATIPIMMYTAQEGELYVGQARALGAVGVLPKEVEPVELSKVLESLRVIGQDAERREHYLEAEKEQPSGVYPALESFDRDLGTLIQELFDQQRAILRRDLRDSREEIAAHVADQIQSPRKGAAPWQGSWLARHMPALLPLAVPILAVLTLALAWLYWQSSRDAAEIRQQAADLELALRQQQDAGSQVTLETGQQMAAYRQALDTSYAVALDSLEWAANQSSTYGFHEEPLSDTRLSMLTELSSHLAALNFRGLIRIESHVGDFCMSLVIPEGYVMASADMAAVECDQIGFAPSAAYELGRRRSVAFANFVSLSDERTGGRIRYEIVSLGNSNPLLAYPATPNGVTASEWNEIAASNHRVVISLYPDSDEGGLAD